MMVSEHLVRPSSWITSSTRFMRASYGTCESIRSSACVGKQREGTVNERSSETSQFRQSHGYSHVSCLSILAAMTISVIEQR